MSGWRGQDQRPPHQALLALVDRRVAGSSRRRSRRRRRSSGRHQPFRQAATSHWESATQLIVYMQVLEDGRQRTRGRRRTGRCRPWRDRRGRPPAARSRCRDRLRCRCCGRMTDPPRRCRRRGPPSRPRSRACSLLPGSRDRTRSAARARGRRPPRPRRRAPSSAEDSRARRGCRPGASAAPLEATLEVRDPAQLGTRSIASAAISRWNALVRTRCTGATMPLSRSANPRPPAPRHARHRRRVRLEQPRGRPVPRGSDLLLRPGPLHDRLGVQLPGRDRHGLHV